MVRIIRFRCNPSSPHAFYSLGEGEAQLSVKELLIGYHVRHTLPSRPVVPGSCISFDSILYEHLPSGIVDVTAVETGPRSM